MFFEPEEVMHAIERGDIVFIDFCDHVWYDVLHLLMYAQLVVLLADDKSVPWHTAKHEFRVIDAMPEAERTFVRNEAWRFIDWGMS